MTRIVVAGASGFIGEALVPHLRAQGAEVAVIGRSGPDARWGDAAALARLVDGADAVINLAGKSVNCRYTPANREALLRSRVDTTRELGAAIAGVATPPPLWINASTATLYRHATDRPQTEVAGERGAGFSVDVATAWEAAFFEAPVPDTRRVALRMAIVLGSGSALTPLVALARTGFGGPQLDGPWFRSRARQEAGVHHEHRRTRGRQRFSWVHLDDVLGVVDLVREREDLSGPLNTVAPFPSDSTELMRVLRRELGVPFGLPLPRPLLELGALAIRTETELLLKSRWVVPERLEEVGYRFRHPRLDGALHAILASGRDR